MTAVILPAGTADARDVAVPVAARVAQSGLALGGRVVFDGTTDIDLAAILAPPTVAAIDAFCAREKTMMAVGPNRLVLRISTQATGRVDVAEAFAEALARRLSLTSPFQHRLRAVVDEAVGNAVIHGNLALDGRLRATREGLAQFAEAMTRRLADAAYGRRPVTVSARWRPGLLTVSVEDRGAGYSPATAMGEAGRHHGRGVPLMRDLCSRLSFAPHARRVTMEFRS